MDKVKSNNRRRLEGEVVSDKMLKTCVVRVNHVGFHSKYKKRYTLSTRLKAHDSENICKLGDRVIIMETRPLSRGKRWRVVSKIEKNISKKKD